MSEEKERVEEKASQADQEAKEFEAEETAGENLSDKIADEAEALDPVHQLEEEKKELQDKYIRLYSEFENFRRRTAKEKQELRLIAAEGLIVDLLPVLDDFERGIDAIHKSEDVKSAGEGVSLIYHKFKGILNRKGLKAIDAKEKEFDLEYHEAMTKFPAPNPEMKGKVIDEIEKGYMLHDKVIRHSKVVVAE